ncbi:hypothetical protein D3C81_1175600 [compost metagenome]
MRGASTAGVGTVPCEGAVVWAAMALSLPVMAAALPGAKIAQPVSHSRFTVPLLTTLPLPPKAYELLA